jgi:hypothetical protein
MHNSGRRKVERHSDFEELRELCYYYTIATTTFLAKQHAILALRNSLGAGAED